MIFYKRFCALLFIIALCCSACKKEEAPQPSARSEAQQNLPKILAFGNSLTAGLGLPASESYPAVLQSMLDSDGYKYEVLNAGVSGDTTAGGLRRIEWSLAEDVEILILELGANDVLRGQPIGEMKSNLAAIIEKARAKNVKVLLAGIEAPTNSGPEYRREVHSAFRDLANEFDVPLIPFVLQDVIASEKYIQVDGTHPNAEGSRVLASTVYRHLKPMLEKRS